MANVNVITVYKYACIVTFFSASILTFFLTYVLTSCLTFYPAFCLAFGSRRPQHPDLAIWSSGPAELGEGEGGVASLLNLEALTQGKNGSL